MTTDVLFIYVPRESLDQVEERKEQFECPEGKNTTTQCREGQKLRRQKLRESAGGNLLIGLFYFISA